MQPEMTMRDHFAAAALTGLLAQGDDGSFSEESYARAAYRWADAMLRERGKLSASDSTAHEGDSCRGGGDCPLPDNAANHDAAPEATAPEPEPSAARRRPAGGTGDTPKPISGGVSDRSKPINGPDPDSRVWETHTLATHATPGEGSVPREGTQEPVAWGVAGLGGVLATSISRRDAVDMQGDYEFVTDVVPLYRQPQATLTFAERATLSEVRDEYADECDDDCNQIAAIIDGLLERLGGGG